MFAMAGLTRCPNPGCCHLATNRCCANLGMSSHASLAIAGCCCQPCHSCSFCRLWLFPELELSPELAELQLELLGLRPLGGVQAAAAHSRSLAARPARQPSPFRLVEDRALEDVWPVHHSVNEKPLLAL